MAKIHARQKDESTGDAKPDESYGISRPLWKAMDYIYYHVHEKITLNEVGEAAGISPNYLNHLFKKEKGITIQKYICAKRIEAAKNMLLYSEYSETEIATFLAFSSTSHFIKTFRENTGTTPRQFVQNNFRSHGRWHK